MGKNRVEAFTDAIIAIIMTILILELRTPDNPTFSSLWDLREKLLIYTISFISLAIYWLKHHQLFYDIKIVNRKILMVNLAFIFSLSFVHL